MFPLVFAPDDGQVLAVHDPAENTFLCNPVTAEQILTFEDVLTGSADALALAPDSLQLVAADSLAEVRVWNPKSDALLEQFDFGHEPPVIAKVGQGRFDLPSMLERRHESHATESQ